MSTAELLQRAPETRQWPALQRVFICFALVVAAYIPCLNNGFIADDYVALQTVDLLKTDPLYLFRVPPTNFRSTSFVAYTVLKQLAGYRAELFYGFNILLHFTNVLLLWHLLTILTEDEFVAAVASALFAVVQGPQEAVMWIAAMNETLLGLFVLLTLILWRKQRFRWSALCYVLALFSKESAMVTLALVPMIHLYKKEKPFTREYLWLVVPSALCAALFLAQWSSNFMISNGFYSFGPQAGVVLLKSLQRLLWPWFYVMVVVLRLSLKKWPSGRTVALVLLCTSVPLLPYIFLVYETTMPSRQVYMATAVLMTSFALMLRPLQRSRALGVFVGAFIAFNIYYLWFKKDPQFMERAVPTTQLTGVFRSQIPTKVRLVDFPYRFPAIAKAAAIAVPGWSPDMIVVSQAESDCPGCPTATWNSITKTYYWDLKGSSQ
jgi:hypothetical protein